MQQGDHLQPLVLPITILSLSVKEWRGDWRVFPFSGLASLLARCPRRTGPQARASWNAIWNLTLISLWLSLFFAEAQPSHKVKRQGCCFLAGFLSLCCWGELQTFLITFSSKYRALVSFLQEKATGGWKWLLYSFFMNEAFYFSLLMLALLSFMEGNLQLMIACCRNEVQAFFPLFLLWFPSLKLGFMTACCWAGH